MATVAQTTQDDMEALDRGVQNAGLTAAEAVARVEALEDRLAAYHQALLLALEYAGIPLPSPRLHLV